MQLKSAQQKASLVPKTSIFLNYKQKSEMRKIHLSGRNQVYFYTIISK